MATTTATTATPASSTLVSHPYKECTAVSEACPVSATTLGYYPNVGFNYFFSVGFGIALVVLLALLVLSGRRRRTKGFTGFIAAGTALELAGYASRIPLHSNPWNKQAFETQICAIILAPTLLCIGIYLTLRHVCLALCPSLSRVRPRLYPWIFVPADVSCLLVQAAGGAIAASAGYTNTQLLSSGNRLIIAGIALQVVVLAVFGLFALDYYVRARRWVTGQSPDPSGRIAGPEARALWADRRFHIFIGAVSIAYTMILIRCIYRIAEMAGGWGSTIMQDEPSFIALESFMILFAVWILTFFPPGFLFPSMARSKKQIAADLAEYNASGNGTAVGLTSNEETEGEKRRDLEAKAAQPDDLGDRNQAGKCRKNGEL